MISPENVFLCSYNDTAGNDFAKRLQEQYPDMKRVVTPDTYKDWNDIKSFFDNVSHGKLLKQMWTMGM